MRAHARLISALAVVAAGAAGQFAHAGTWTAAPSSASNNGPAFGLWLLTDGTVMSHGDALNHWVKLTPNKQGSYAAGTWTTLASSAFARGGAQEHVLKDGRFFEAGGEFLYAWPAHDGVAACASNCTNPAGGSALFKNVEIYDPVANTWTVEADAPYDIGDTGSATLADGRILDSTRVSSATQIFDPSTNTWTTGGANTVPNGDENAWASLQNGGVLAVAPMATSIYDPVSNKWTKNNALPTGFAVTLTAASGYPGTYDFGDTSGISLMFDGRVLAYGLGTTAIYTPGATATTPGSWALGPDMPYKTGPLDGTPGNEGEDEYTDTEPNGKVMMATHAFGDAIDTLQEYDPTSNTFAVITPPPDTQNPYPISYVNLPNGQVMVTCGGRDWLYTPDGAPQDAWRPTVSSVAFNSGTTYTLTGTQLSGLINGGDEGDDMTMAENYPIVWLTDASNNVYYCKSFNFSSMMPSKGSTPQTCQFTTPAGLPTGSYNLFVSAAGVQSKTAFPFTTGSSTTTGAGGAGGTGAGGTSGTATGAAGTSGTGTAGTNGTTTGTAGTRGGTAGTSGTTTTGTAGTNGTITTGAAGTNGTTTTGAAGTNGTTTGIAGTNGTTTGAGGINGSGTAGTSGTTTGTAGKSGGGAGSSGQTGGSGSSGCACSSAGTAGNAGQNAGLLMLIGIMFGVARRRRATSSKPCTPTRMESR